MVTRKLIVLLSAATVASPIAIAAADPSSPPTPQTSFATAQKIAGATAAAGWTAWSEKSGSAWQLKVRSPAGGGSPPGGGARPGPVRASRRGPPRGGVVGADSPRPPQPPP